MDISLKLQAPIQSLPRLASLLMEMDIEKLSQELEELRVADGKVVFAIRHQDMDSAELMKSFSQTLSLLTENGKPLPGTSVEFRIGWQVPLPG